VIIGYAYVVADLFHIGHLKHLQSCKSKCDKLIVGVLNNEATMEKKRKPIISFEERMEIIRGLKCVDCAVEQKTYSPLENAVNANADVLFESTSHTPQAIAEAEETMLEVGGKVITMPYYEGQSSTAIKHKVVAEWGNK